MRSSRKSFILTAIITVVTIVGTLAIAAGIDKLRQDAKDKNSVIRAVQRQGEIGGESDPFLTDPSKADARVDVAEDGFYYVYAFIPNTDEIPKGSRLAVFRPSNDSGKECTFRAQIISEDGETILREDSLTFTSDQDFTISVCSDSGEWGSSDSAESVRWTSFLNGNYSSLEESGYQPPKTEGLTIEGINAAETTETNSETTDAGKSDVSEILRFEVEVAICRDYTWEAKVTQTDRSDEVEVTFTYTNTGEEMHEDVCAYFYTDSGNYSDRIKLVPGSAVLTNSAHPDGVPLQDNLGNDYTLGMNAPLGSYAPGGQATITFRLRSEFDDSVTDEVVNGRVSGSCEIGLYSKYTKNNLCASQKCLYEYGDDPSMATNEFLKSGNVYAVEDGQLLYDPESLTKQE